MYLLQSEAAIGAASTTVSACNGSDTVFGSTTPITAKGGGSVSGSNSGNTEVKMVFGGGVVMMVQAYLAQLVTTNHGSSRAGFAEGKGDHGTGGGGGGAYVWWKRGGWIR